MWRHSESNTALFMATRSKRHSRLDEFCLLQCARAWKENVSPLSDSIFGLKRLSSAEGLDNSSIRSQLTAVCIRLCGQHEGGSCPNALNLFLATAAPAASTWQDEAFLAGCILSRTNTNGPGDDSHFEPRDYIWPPVDPRRCARQYMCVCLHVSQQRAWISGLRSSSYCEDVY